MVGEPADVDVVLVDLGKLADHLIRPTATENDRAKPGKRDIHMPSEMHADIVLDLNVPGIYSVCRYST